MWKDGGEIRETGQLHEAANESVKGSGGSDVDASKNSDNATAYQGGIEGVVHPRVDMSEPARERSRSVTRDSPQGATSSDVATSASDDCGYESHDKQTDCTAPGSCCLTVNLGKGESVDAIDDCVEIGD